MEKPTRNIFRMILLKRIREYNNRLKVQPSGESIDGIKTKIGLIY